MLEMQQQVIRAKPLIGSFQFVKSERETDDFAVSG
jgi:hypothetical protein